MPVRVRMFAALREAAGQGEDVALPGPLPALLDELRARHGERFATVLAACSVLVDGTAVARDADIEVRDGAELALLPPVSGGAGTVTVARALGSSTRADIYAHLREAGDERTVRDIASRFELHPNVARTHLELLAEAGLVSIGRRKHPGGGRPAKVYVALGDERPRAPVPRAEPQVDSALLVRLLAALLEAPGVDASGRPVVASARRTTLAGRAYETAVAEGRRLVGGRRPPAPALSEAVDSALAALRPCAPQVRVAATGEDFVDVTGLREVVAPLVGIRPDLADAFQRGLWSGAFSAAGLPVTLIEAGLSAGGDDDKVWRARAAIGPRQRVSSEPCARVDTRGLPRDEAVVAAVRAAQTIGRGDVLEVLTEGPGSPAAFARWADRSGHQIVSVERAPDGAAIRLLVRRG